MAAWYASQGMTLYDALQALFEKYGYYGEKTMNLVMPGLDGLKKMADLMAGLREQPRWRSPAWRWPSRRTTRTAAWSTWPTAPGHHGALRLQRAAL